MTEYEEVSVEEMKSGHGRLPLQIQYSASGNLMWREVTRIENSKRPGTCFFIRPKSGTEGSFYPDRFTKYRRPSNFLPMRRQDINPEKVT